MAENTNECVIEWIPGRDYVGLTAKNGSAWKNRCEELEKEFPEDVKKEDIGKIFDSLTPYIVLTAPNYQFVKDKFLERYNVEIHRLKKTIAMYEDKIAAIENYKEDAKC